MSDFFLPEALMLNIWLRLPIKSTVRFRCVSKSWCASLSDLHFIYKNLTFFDAEKKHDLLLVLDWKRQYYSVVSHETLAATPLQVSPLREIPSADPWHRAVLTYSCDDLVCFHNESGEVIGVWNLTTGETKIVPPVLDDGSPILRFHGVGFGFDEKRKDYKIVQILSHPSDFVAYVYSLGSGNNCWRKLDAPNVPKARFGNPCMAYCRSYRDGTFYWGVSDDLVVSFDMSGEVFNTISIPYRPHQCINQICRLREGSMFVITRSYNYETDDIPEIVLWALLEIGLTQSWTKLFIIDWIYGNDMPLGFWRNELLFQSYSNNSQLLISDPSKQETKKVQIDEPLDILSCYVWTKGKNSILLN